MSNIRGFRDFQAENNERAPLMGPRPNMMPFISTAGQQGDPRKESCFQMCKLTCCPVITIKSFTAIITIVDIVMFIVTLCFGIVRGGETEFLTPKMDTLILFGDRNVFYIITKYQVWRFLTPVFLHANFLHIFFNCFSQLIFGSQVEVMLGTKLFVVLYFLCGVGGNVFGGLFEAGDAVGASTAIVGLLGVFIAFVIVNWKKLDSQMKCFMLCMVFFIIIINLVFSVGPSSKESAVDNYGHLGGLLTGTFAGMFLVKPQGGATLYEKRVKIIGQCLTVFFFVLCFCLFYLVVYKGKY